MRRKRRIRIMGIIRNTEFGVQSSEFGVSVREFE
jgi:hypothetical protein